MTPEKVSIEFDNISVEFKKEEDFKFLMAHTGARDNCELLYIALRHLFSHCEAE